MPEILTPDVSNFLAKELSLRRGKEKNLRDKLTLPRRETLPREIINIAENVANISGTWNPVEFYTPDDEIVSSEKAKFLDSFSRGETYNPIFIYKKVDGLDMTIARRDLLGQIDALRKFKLSKRDRKGRLMRAALYFKIKDDLATCDLVEGMQSKDEKKIARALKQKYPGVDDTLIKSANTFYNNLFSDEKIKPTVLKEKGYPVSDEERKYIKEKKLSAEEFAEAVRWALKELGLLKSERNPDGFNVILDKDTTSVDVRDKSSKGPHVSLPASRERTLDDVLGLLNHEIRGHARQSINGWKLFMVGGGKLKVDNEMLYEGLGKRYDDEYNRKFFGTTGGEPAPYFTFAVAKAEAGASFYEIFADQVNLRLRVSLKMPEPQSLPREINSEVLQRAKEGAWTTTYRVMRGHTDMANPEKYAMAKDLAYLRGFLVDKQLRDNDFSFINEAGVIPSGGLQILAELKLAENNLPVKDIDLATKYWEKIAKPQMLKSQREFARAA